MGIRTRSQHLGRTFSALSLALAGGGLFGGSPSARAQSTIVANFAGLNQTDIANANGFNLAPPDTDGCIGPNGNYVQFINGGYAVYNTSGAQQSFTTDTAFWNAAGISTALTGQGLSDTRVKYDPGSGRWFASEITLGTNSVNNSVLLAVSSGSSPTGWKATSYTAISGSFGDYPTLGVDANAVYVGTNNFSSAGSFNGVTLSSIPKSSLLASTPTVTGLAAFNQGIGGTVGYTPQGVNNGGTGYTTGLVLGVSNTTYNQVQLSTITGPAAPGATLTSKTLAVTYDGNATLQHQANGSQTLDGGDRRIGSAVLQVGSKIYAVNAINNGNTGANTAAGFDTVHWMVFNATTGTLLHDGLISDTNRDLTYPSIAANAAGDIVIGYSKAGADLNLSSMASVGHTDASGNITFEAPLTLKTSTVTGYTDGFNGATSRFGDYSATNVDPNDPTKFWTIQEVPTGATTWGTEISELFVTVPEAGGWTSLGVVGAALLAAAWRRRLKAEG